MCLLLLLVLVSDSIASAQAIDPQAAANVRAGIEARQQNRLDDDARELEASVKLAPGSPRSTSTWAWCGTIKASTPRP